MVSLLLAIIYISFISLGLPDSLLGSAWPIIYPELNVPISWSGIIFMIISIGTVISSLQSDRLTKKLGAGRAVNGFLTFKLSDTKLIHLGQGIIATGILMLVLPVADIVALTGFIMIGVGCAPIYPCVIHSTPVLFGKDKSQAMVGVQMASAYVGTSVMPPLFGFLSNIIGISMLPAYLLIILVIQFIMYNRVVKIAGKQ